MTKTYLCRDSYLNKNQPIYNQPKKSYTHIPEDCYMDNNSSYTKYNSDIESSNSYNYHYNTYQDNITSNYTYQRKKQKKLYNNQSRYDNLENQVGIIKHIVISRDASRCYGFIGIENRKDLHFHFDAIKYYDYYGNINPQIGDCVKFEIFKQKNGKLKALNIFRYSKKLYKKFVVNEYSQPLNYWNRNEQEMLSKKYEHDTTINENTWFEEMDSIYGGSDVSCCYLCNKDNVYCEASSDESLTEDDDLSTINGEKFEKIQSSNKQSFYSMIMNHKYSPDLLLELRKKNMPDYEKCLFKLINQMGCDNIKKIYVESCFSIINLRKKPFETQLNKTINGLLNKITKNNEEIITNKLIEYINDTQLDNTQTIIKQILSKCIHDKLYIKQYAYILNKLKLDTLLIYNMLYNYIKLYKNSSNLINLIKLLGYLYMNNTFNESQIWKILIKLKSTEIHIIAVYNLLNIIGKKFDTNQNISKLDTLLADLLDYCHKQNYKFRIIYFIEELIVVRGNNWNKIKKH